MPALQQAVTISGPDTRNMGAAMTGSRAWFGLSIVEPLI
jgi:hypothetical protein